MARRTPATGQGVLALSNGIKESATQVAVRQLEQAVRSTNTNVSTLAGQMTGRLLSIQTLVASGVYIPTPGITSVIVEMSGGGGGGGGAEGTASGIACAAGGGSGVYLKLRVLSAGGIVGGAVTVGTGGTGGVGSSAGVGGNGTATSIVINGTTYTAQGGQGGGGMVGTTTGPVGVLPGAYTAGSSTGGNVLITSAASGTPGLVDVGLSWAWTGAGGSNPMGAGGPTLNWSAVTSTAGSGFGGGGSGASATTVSVNGGAGAHGGLIVYEYA